MCSAYPPLPPFREQWLTELSYDDAPAKPDALAEHKARMAAEHAKTMRQARLGMALLVGLVITLGYALADFAGWLP